MQVNVFFWLKNKTVLTTGSPFSNDGVALSAESVTMYEYCAVKKEEKRLKWERGLADDLAGLFVQFNEQRRPHTCIGCQSFGAEISI